MAEWTAEYINDLPDASFACIDSGGEKEDGRTVPDYNVASALAVALGVKLDALTETTDAKS